MSDRKRHGKKRHEPASDPGTAPVAGDRVPGAVPVPLASATGTQSFAVNCTELLYALAMGVQRIHNGQGPGDVLLGTAKYLAGQSASYLAVSEEGSGKGIFLWRGYVSKAELDDGWIR